ncbi:MAG: adenosylcobinamide-GDP ribazoletransferase [Thermodesulfobacteriota bacterium]
MKQFFAAIQFLTTIPVNKDIEFRPSLMISYFPAVGLLLGAVVFLFDYLASMLWSVPLVSFLDVVLLIVLTGALHLDGLGDTADGMFSHRSREEKLSIMKDSRVGVMGVVSIFCVLILKWGAIQEISASRGLILFLVLAYSRTAMMFAIKFLPYGRPEGGTGKDFFSGRIPPSYFWGLLVLVPLSFLMGWRAVWFNLVFVLFTAAILIYYYRSLKCVTGDNLGALNEMTEAILFLTAGAGMG